MVWFTVPLANEPGALAQLATALAGRGINITGIIGMAEDGGGELMLATSNPAAAREVLAGLGLGYEEQPDDAPGDDVAASPGTGPERRPGGSL